MIHLPATEGIEICGCTFDERTSNEPAPFAIRVVGHRVRDRVRAAWAVLAGRVSSVTVVR